MTYPRNIPPDAIGPGWTIEFFGDPNLYRIKYTSEAIVQTGANVDTTLEIRYPHRFAHMEFKHTDSAGDDSVLAHTIYFARYKWGGNTTPFTIYSEVADVTADNMRICGDGYEFPKGSYRLRTNGTATTRVWPEFVVQVLSMKGSEFVRK